MRVSTAFNKILAIPGATVRDVEFTPDGVIIDIARRARKLLCPCGVLVSGRYDTSTRQWRHLDMGACKTLLRAQIRRLWCPACRRVRTEEVSWARPSARHTRDFEDMVCWLAQRADKTTISKLMRCSWRGVDDIIARVVFEQIDGTRLDNLYRIGVDEISYRRGRRYITLVADHDTGRVVWGGKGAGKHTMLRFYQELGATRAAQLEAVSMDMGPGYRQATELAVPHAKICFDPFHIIQRANRAIDVVYANAAQSLAIKGPEWTRRRFTLRRAGENLSEEERDFINGLRRQRHALARAWELKEELRDLYRIAPEHAVDYLKAWITRALRSRIRPFQILAHLLQRHFAGVINTVQLGLSNSRLEGINSRVRLIHRRGYGYHSAAALIALTYLTCGGLTIALPTRT